MWFFKWRKKRPQLFGNNIEPKCTYCNYNCGEEEIVCSLSQNHTDDGACKSFEYDPLMRKPKLQTFVKNDFTDEDFKL